MENIVWDIIDCYFRDNPQSLVRHHLESYNDFYKEGIFRIFNEMNPITLVSKFDEKTKEYKSKCNLYLGGKDGKRIYFAKPVIIFAGSCNVNNALASGDTALFKFYKGASATAFLTMTLSSGILNTSNTSVSETIGINEYLSISCTTAGSIPHDSGGNRTIFTCNASTY